MSPDGLTSHRETVPTRDLQAAEAAERLRRDGPNELPQEQPRSVVRIAFDAIREPMLQLLLAAGVIYLVLGDLGEALVLLAFAMVNIGLVVAQETRTERALAALKDLTSPRALVIRDGQPQRVPARELVVDDLIIVAEGDRVPADAILLTQTDLEADESLLTGESVPVRKVSGGPQHVCVRPGGDDNPFVWSGTLIVRGRGEARVVATGARSEIGRIGKSLGNVESAPTPLQVQTRRLVRLFAAGGISASVLLALVYGALRGAWLTGILSGITLAMATLPEEFPVVLTVFLVLGAWRISQHRVLTRRTAAIEALGAATVLCTDKTGTLTLNRMRVVRLVADGEQYETERAASELPERFHTLVEFAILASRPDPFDPMERAFHELGQRLLAQTEHLHADWTLAHGYPLAPDLLAMSQVWCAREGDRYVVAAKGAPEAIADLCHLAADRVDGLRAQVASLAAEGLRVLAVARGTYAGPDWPGQQHDFDFEFLGLLGLADPLRPEVPAAVRACTGAGVRVAMITGDHPVTARAIARQAGIPAAEVLSGDELARIDDTALRARIRETSVFARIMPEQKLRLVQAFAANGEIVAMTGDGVNDAPSLRAAHIGVAMGGRGTDVAREAASLVLLDDNFSSLVAAVRLGRRIGDNLRKAFGYIMAVHVPIAGMSLIPVLLGWPAVLGPIHVVFLELIIDPMASIVFEAEPEAPDVMARPPRQPTAPLFDIALLIGALAQGAVVLATTLGVLWMARHDAAPEPAARSTAFLALVLGNLGLVLVARSLGAGVWRTLANPTRAFGMAISGTLLALVLVLAMPWLRQLFGMAPATEAHILLAIVAAVIAIAASAAIGRFWFGLASLL